MKLKALLEGMPGVMAWDGDDTIDVCDIAIHSAQASRDKVFVALPGTKADGHAFLEEAYRAGSRVFVTQKPFRMPGVSNLVVADTRLAIAALAARLYGDPSRQMQLIGITGTNGKTTTAFLIESILQAAGTAAGLIGTVVYRFGGASREADRTTPDQLGLQRLLRDMAATGTRCAVMEVSSHGLQQRRVDGCHFDAAVFTNLTPEHLDYHGTMEDYFRSKERLFTEVLPASVKPRTAAIINGDDPRGALLRQRTPCRTIVYGCRAGDVYAAGASLTLGGIAADIVTPRGRCAVQSPLVGRFNLSNILAAVATADFFDIPCDAIRRGIAALRGVPGRMERIDNDCGVQVFIDYAHTGDALAQVLTTLRQLGADRIITVFGCGGDRDRAKRPVMGATAAEHSTVVVLTSDNPRSEDPAAIIAEIEAGIQSRGAHKAEPKLLTTAQPGRYAVLPDRRTAIRTAVAISRPGDVVLIAGKGHETYQEIGGVRTHFDDREEARAALQQAVGGR